MIGVDVGGTFTDVVRIKDGKPTTAKVQTRKDAVHQSVIDGAAQVGPTESMVFNHASTHGLNAVLTRRLPKVALLTTAGHRDVLDRGRLIRPAEALTDPFWRRSFGDASRPLVPRYLRRGVVERVGPDGAALIALDEEHLIAELEVLGRCDVDGVAICLLHAHVDDRHERRVAELVREHLPGVRVSLSSEVSPLAREYARTSTTVIDVIMKLIYTDYNADLLRGLRAEGFTGSLNYADSAATLLPAEVAMRQPHRVVFAGPAMGTAACEQLGQAIDDGNMLCVDIGGTSCDLSVIVQGSTHRNTTFEFEHDMLVNSLSTDLTTLGAGGGSIAHINEVGELRVGPESAGGVPGPACYGLGGERPTMTDAALLMGLIDADSFAGGSITLHPERAVAAFASLQAEGSLGEKVANTWRIGLNNIVEGVYNIALARGLDSSDFSVVAYGAAGPMMLPAILDHVKVRRVVVPPHPGLFSALGLLTTDLVYSDSRSSSIVLAPDAAETIEAQFAEMEVALLATLGESDRAHATVHRSFDGRLLGQGWDMPLIELPRGAITAEVIPTLIERFHDEYERRNGIRFEWFPVQTATLRVRVIVASEKYEFERIERRESGGPTPMARTSIDYLYGDPVDAEVYDRDSLRGGDRIEGPAIVREAMSTTVVPAQRVLTVGAFGELYIE
jgi:N-methylhydantoinase A